MRPPALLFAQSQEPHHRGLLSMDTPYAFASLMNLVGTSLIPLRVAALPLIPLHIPHPCAIAESDGPHHGGQARQKDLVPHTSVS